MTRIELKILINNDETWGYIEELIGAETNQVASDVTAFHETEKNVLREENRRLEASHEARYNALIEKRLADLKEAQIEIDVLNERLIEANNRTTV